MMTTTDKLSANILDAKPFANSPIISVLEVKAEKEQELKFNSNY